MSVAAHSPFCGTKRYFEPSPADEQPENYINFSSGKRGRFGGGSPGPAGGRCTPLTERRAAYVVSGPAVAALRALFPEMNEQAIANVLQECGDDVEAAIRCLNELSLASNGAGAVTRPALDAGGQLGPDAPDAAGATAEGEQQPQQAPIDLSRWAETVLQQMADAKDVADARQRATSVVQALATAVAESVALQANSSDGNEVVALREQVAELAKDNHILKRAVAIQNGRLQELSGREAEAAQLRQLLAQYQEKLHSLELSNYSLALHLKQAAGAPHSVPGSTQRHPDVF